MKKMVVVDIDDVLADTTEALRRFVNKEYGHSLITSHYRIKGKYWGYYETVWSQHDINGDGIVDRFHLENSKGGINIDPISGTIDAITQLAQKYRLAAVSSRTSIQENQTKVWLKEVFGDVFESIHCIDSRHTGVTKGGFCQELGASYLIDDNTEHCESALAAGITPVLYGVYGWQNAPERFKRCKNWIEVLEFFENE